MILSQCRRRHFFQYLRPRYIYRVTDQSARVKVIPDQPNSLRRRNINPLLIKNYPKPKDTSVSFNIESSKETVYLALFGNMVITLSKAAVCVMTGSSAMLSEAIHSLVDSGNQALLLVGLRGAETVADSRHQYGYGKSIYFWSLVSALGTFWCGAGISMWNSVQALLHPSIELHTVGWETWAVLAVAFGVDGGVLYKTLQKVRLTQPPNLSLLQHIRRIRDPTMQAVLMEDAAACGGVLIAVLGIGAAQVTGLAVLDALAGMGVSCVLGAMGLYLARLNQKYLMGQAVETEITDGIKRLLLSQRSIDEVHSVQSQWVGPYSFSYKAEIDFDGTYIAAKLMNRYKSEFLDTKNIKEDEIKLLLSWYSEDVIREVEMEIRGLEARIRRRYPEALYIELEPDGGKNKDDEYMQYAIDLGRSEKDILDREMESINQYEAAFIEDKEMDLYRDMLEYNRGDKSNQAEDL